MRATQSCECDQQGEIEGWSSALKPGGRIQIADILLQRPVPEGSKRNVTLWTGCIAGGLLKVQLERGVNAAGFKEVEVVWGKGVFSGAPQHSDAAEFGTLGVTIRAQKDVRA
jgi:arsenite methyltransferase